MKSIAVLCNYRIEAERIGGMDYFFWAFDEAARQCDYSVTWFFPNHERHGKYKEMQIQSNENITMETHFLQSLRQSETHYNTIVCHFLELCTPFYNKVKTLTNARIIAVDHNPRPINGYPLEKKIRKRIKGWLYSKYIDQFIGVSEYTRIELINDFGDQIANKSSVIYNGIDLSQITIRENRNKVKPKFLVACHLRESKGVQDLIRAVNIMHEDIKGQLHIDVYGDGPYRSKLEKLVVQHNLTAQFTFHGSNNRLHQIYHQYDYLIHPTHMECFSLGILESLAANVPVITTPVGGNEEVVEDGINGYIFPVKDITSLSALIEDLYSGTKTIVGDISLNIRLKFTIEKMVQKHLDII